MKETDKRYIEFVESQDMSIPDNDCTDYREQSDYQAIAFMEAKLQVAVEALEFYGDKQNWQQVDSYLGMDSDLFKPDDEEFIYGTGYRCGKKAREVLEKISEDL